MEIDRYWATRTTAEAQDQGYSHLRATCSGCARITDIPWLHRREAERCIVLRMWRRRNSLKIFERRHIAGRFA